MKNVFSFEPRHQRLVLLITFSAAAILSTWVMLKATEASGLEDRAQVIATRLKPPFTQSPPDPAAQNENPPWQRGGGNWGSRGGGWPGQATPADPNDPVAMAVQRITERRLFSPAPPEAFRSVVGVLGDRVLYPGGQSFGVGENAMGATVTAIGPDWVKLEHNGQEVEIKFLEGGAVMQGGPGFQVGPGGEMNGERPRGRWNRGGFGGRRGGGRDSGG